MQDSRRWLTGDEGEVAPEIVSLYFFARCEVVRLLCLAPIGSIRLSRSSLLKTNAGYENGVSS